MTLSILCVTNNEYNAQPFILRMHTLATALGAELVLGLDREKAQKAKWRKLANVALDLTANTLQEDVLDKAISACSGEWVLRLDDDETVSLALEGWLRIRAYEDCGASLYSFPRVYLYPDAEHILCNNGIYPDLQTRLGKKDWMYGFNTVHSGNPHGPGTTVPYAIEHHKLIARTLEQRQTIADRYESIRPGAGTFPQYARYNLPEKFYPELEVMEYVNGDFSAR